MKKNVNVAVIIVQWYGPAYDMQCGILRYAKANPRWGSVHIGAPMPAVIPWLKEHNPDGIIFHPARDLSGIEKITAPKVSIGPDVGTEGWIGVDDHAIGAAAAEHLLDQGLQRFAFAGKLNSWNMPARSAGFHERLAKAGFSEESSCAPDLMVKGTETRDKWLDKWNPVRAKIDRWIRSLEVPVGVFAAYDALAWELAFAVRQAGRRIPEEIAIVGSNDTILAEQSRPSLSSVIVPWESLGYGAAELLDLAMEGKRPRSVPLLCPLGVAVRQSSDIIGMRNPQIAKAMGFIRQYADRSITVDDVAEEMSVSRRRLERQFHRVLDRSPSKEIQRVRLETARSFLARTQLTIFEVARRSGFPSDKQMYAGFQKEMQMTPKEYRNKFCLQK